MWRGLAGRLFLELTAGSGTLGVPSLRVASVVSHLVRWPVFCTRPSFRLCGQSPTFKQLCSQLPPVDFCSLFLLQNNPYFQTPTNLIFPFLSFFAHYLRCYVVPFSPKGYISCQKLKSKPLTIDQVSCY